MKQPDKVFVGFVPAQEAIKEIKDDDNFIIQEAEPAKEEVPGVEVNIRMPIPFDVIVEATKFMDDTMFGMIKAGEVVVRSCVINMPKEIEEDGELMSGLCLHCFRYVNPSFVKKNSIAPDTSTKTED